MHEQQLESLVDGILQDYHSGRDIDRMDRILHPDKASVVDIIEKLRCILFPGYLGGKTYCEKENLRLHMEDVIFRLNRQVSLALEGSGEAQTAAREKAQRICQAFFQQLPQVRQDIQTDLQAAYDGDPAAASYEEIIFSYPGLFAVTVYRLAHLLHGLHVPMLPRMMTEYAHSVTGIDIHPGATIGQYFFIDHGTGIVIGETTIVGDHVKVYQGVTLGGLSTSGGQSLRGIKRHPTIEDYVTIYAGASILGGETVIGNHAVIGANAFITQSVAPCTTVFPKMQDLQMRARHCAGCEKANGDFSKAE